LRRRLLLLLLRSCCGAVLHGGWRRDNPLLADMSSCMVCCRAQAMPALPCSCVRMCSHRLIVLLL